jgi:hypothetical protein
MALLSGVRKVFPSVKIVRNSEKIQRKSLENQNQFFYNIQLLASRRFLLAARSLGKKGRILFITSGQEGSNPGYFTNAIC